MVRIPSRKITYDGQMYKSVLESEWAKWLNYQNIAFEYEPSKFDLGPVNYIPDFYLTEYKCWIEVKPDKAPPLEQLLKIAGIARIRGEKTFLVAGRPTINVKFWTYNEYGIQSVQGKRSDPKEAFEISSKMLLTRIKGVLDLE